jgi:hypothetical protein
VKWDPLVFPHQTRRLCCLWISRAYEFIAGCCSRLHFRISRLGPRHVICTTLCPIMDLRRSHPSQCITDFTFFFLISAMLAGNGHVWGTSPRPEMQRILNRRCRQPFRWTNSAAWSLGMGKFLVCNPWEVGQHQVTFATTSENTVPVFMYTHWFSLYSHVIWMGNRIYWTLTDPWIQVIVTVPLIHTLYSPLEHTLKCFHLSCQVLTATAHNDWTPALLSLSH